MTSSASPEWQNLRDFISSPSRSSSLNVRPATPMFQGPPFCPNEIVPAVAHVIRPNIVPHIQSRGRAIWFIRLQNPTSLIQLGTRLRILFMDNPRDVKFAIIQKYWQEDEENIVMECFVQDDLSALLVIPRTKAHIWPPSWKDRLCSWFSCRDNQIYFSDQ